MESVTLSEFLPRLVDWLVLHPTWAGLAVFMISLAESLVGVGLFIPGTIVMFSIGALVALGALGLWATLLWAIAGAVVGDGLSFWIGHHYREHMRSMWPFNRHPEWLERAETFFHRHGGKSIVFGRFAGPVRPIIPAVAGMLGMPPGYFYTVNIISAVLWAPAYILPGVVLGASISLAAGVASRLALLVVLCLGGLWLSAWLVRRTYLVLQPRAQRFLQCLLGLCEKRPWLLGIRRELQNPHHPSLLVLFELLVLLLLALMTFVPLLAWQIHSSGPLPQDAQIYFLLQKLRTPWADHLMIGLTEFSNTPSSLAVLGGGLVWLAWCSHWHGLGYWLGGALLGLGTLYGVHYFFPMYPPGYVVGVAVPLLDEARLVINTVIYGFLAVIVAGHMPFNWRHLPYTTAALWIVAISFASLYLAEHWFSDILLAITLGLIWVALLGFVYRSQHSLPRNRHSERHVSILLSIALAGLLCTGSWQVTRHHGANMERYAVKSDRYMLAESAWWEQEWSSVESYRVDLASTAEQPMTIQWAGKLENIQAYLEKNGWQQGKPLGMESVIHWLLPEPKLEDLPILPTVHDGHHESLRLMRLTKEGNKRLVLRLWHSSTSLDREEGEKALWVGNITRQHLENSLGLLSLPTTEVEFESPLQFLQNTLDGCDWRLVKRLPDESRRVGWQGQVLLIR